VTRDMLCNISCMKLIVKYFFLMDVLFSGVKLDVDKHINTFSPGRCFVLGGHFILESSCNWVNTVYIIYIYIHTRTRACYTYCAISVSECTLQ
jgi:hypothetical protein